MLKPLKNKLFIFYVLTVIFLQLWLIFHLQLFGDESFYWLEGQFLALSYSELPGWTAWMIRAGTTIFGNNYFGVRIISYVAFLSIFVGIYLINQKIKPQNKDPINYLLVLSIPLFTLVAVMALPDIWMVFFAVWIIYFINSAIRRKRLVDWILLGLIIAISLNVHVRMWIWLFFASLTFLYCFRHRKELIKSVLLISMPISILGLLPILIFNYHNDFTLFTFQFEQRHPWQFQWKNISFLLSQILIISPLILLLWFAHLAHVIKNTKKNPIVTWIILTAALHWIFYIIMSLFVDGLRTTVHWLLISYVPVLAICSVVIKNKILPKFAIVTGGFITIIMLLFIGFNKYNANNLQSRILDNSIGWQKLSTSVKRLQIEYKIENIIADYFMTASELAFELKSIDNIKVLPHSKNIKHGRQKQLEIFGMLLDEPQFYQK